MSKQDIIRALLHFPVGVVCAVIAIFNPINGGLAVLTFLTYETLNDWRKDDWSFKDVFGFAFGLMITLLAFYLWLFFRY